jgi:hypothetical protein
MQTINQTKIIADLAHIRQLIDELNPLMDAIIANHGTGVDFERDEGQSMLLRGFDDLDEGAEKMEIWANSQTASTAR